MRKLRTIIVDDEEMATKVITKHLELVNDFEVVGIYHSAVEAFLAVDRDDVDVLFLDIQMPKLTGIEMLQMLQRRPMTIITTAFREYAVAGFDLDVIDYLVKPIGTDRFLKTVAKIRRMAAQEVQPQTSVSHYIFVRANREYHRVNHEDIYFVEAVKNHVKIVTSSTTLMCLLPISELLDKIGSPAFVRVHRSYFVNTKHITAFTAQQVTVDGKIIPIGRSYREEVKRQLDALV